MLNVLNFFSENCPIVENKNFLKRLCSDGTSFQCLYSDEVYQITSSYTQFSVFSNVCPNDPSFYQVCGALQNEVTTSSGEPGFGYYVCTASWNRLHFSSDFLELIGRECDSEASCTNTHLDKASCEEWVTLPTGMNTTQSNRCNGQCEVLFCEDEAVCNGYTYGVYCNSSWDGYLWYAGPLYICDGYEHCSAGEDENGCSATEASTTQHSCISSAAE